MCQSKGRMSHGFCLVDTAAGPTVNVVPQVAKDDEHSVAKVRAERRPPADLIVRHRA